MMVCFLSVLPSGRMFFFIIRPGFVGEWMEMGGMFGHCGVWYADGLWLGLVFLWGGYEAGDDDRA
jgi:hypothetical protein